MALEVKNILRFPAEVLNKIYAYAIPDFPNDVWVEPVKGDPWCMEAWIYKADGDGALKRIRPSRIDRALFAVCRKTRQDNQGQQFWEKANLLFSDSLLLWELTPVFSISIRKITIVKYFEQYNYSGLNNPSQRRHPGNDTCVFRSIACLKICPRLEAITIHVSIYNCEHQYSVSETLSEARAIMGDRAHLQVAVKHCVNCDPDDHAFGIPLQGFAAFGEDNLPERHGVTRRQYWEWACEAGSDQWEIQRFGMKDNVKSRIYCLEEYLAAFEKDKVALGEAVALEKMKDVARTLQAAQCVFCETACDRFPEDLRNSRGLWCARCGTHPWCGRPQCPGSFHPLSTDCIIGPPELTFVTASPINIPDYMPAPNRPVPQFGRGRRGGTATRVAPQELRCKIADKTTDEEMDRLDRARGLDNYREIPRY